MNVYIVDDYHAMASTLAKLFEIMGHEAKFETNATKAKAFCSNKSNIDRLDFVILDIFLNGINGIDIYEVLQKNNMENKVIFATGCDNTEKSYQDAVVTKRPIVMKKFNPKDFITALANNTINDFAKKSFIPTVKIMETAHFE